MKEFYYNNKKRNVIVTEETPIDLMGFDLSLLSDEEVNKLMSCFRHFKKTEIKEKIEEEKQEVEKPKKFYI